MFVLIAMFKNTMILKYIWSYINVHDRKFIIRMLNCRDKTTFKHTINLFIRDDNVCRKSKFNLLNISFNIIIKPKNNLHIINRK